MALVPPLDDMIGFPINFLYILFFTEKTDAISFHWSFSTPLPVMVLITAYVNPVGKFRTKVEIEAVSFTPLLHPHPDLLTTFPTLTASTASTALFLSQLPDETKNK